MEYFFSYTIFFHSLKIGSKKQLLLFNLLNECVHFKFVNSLIELIQSEIDRRRFIYKKNVDCI